MRPIIALIILFVGVIFVSFIWKESVFATTPCSVLPAYTDDLEKYYDNIEINQDSCYPGFSFNTPVLYSNHAVSYKISNRTFDFMYESKKIEEMDSKLRAIILALESCQDFRKYADLIGVEQRKNFNPNSFVSSEQVLCNIVSLNADELLKEKNIDTFLNSQPQFGGYKSCKPTDGYNYESLYVICDNRVKENIRFVVKDDRIVEAYFQNSYSESYRKIYPEDIFIKERNPAWERMEKTQRIIMFGIGIFVLFSLAGLIYVKKKIIHK